MDFFQPDPFADAAENVLEKNLSALARTSPKAAQLIRAASARPDIVFAETAGGVLTATFAEGRQLASRRDPISEAERLADTINVMDTAGIAVVGFGLGYHLKVVAERLNKSGLLMCFEPDVELLRAVFERIDCSSWMLRTNFALLTDADDGAMISRVLQGLEGVIALGVRVVDHPPSRARLAETGATFAQRFTDVLKAIRTAIVTTLVQSEVTLRNLLMNADHYAQQPGLNDLASACLRVPAVVVSAGPSLERNIAALEQPGIRDRVVIIAVQTVLKTLLSRGIRPHFVCALDHHEISTRFYEGLTAADVEGVTLVAEPKANPAILEAFPGAIRCLGNDLLDMVMENSGLPMAAKTFITPGATVSHLCYYLARHIGCDPVILCGQDLGFTDGQYYAAGAAIHNVWAAELGPFNTIEMMEWQRIAREKSLLRRKVDVTGRSIFTDEQMATYLAQFEADFLKDKERGLRVIDATEGGVLKQHTEPMSLADAIEQFGSKLPFSLPFIERSAISPEVRAKLKSRVFSIRADARRVHTMSKDVVRMLKKMLRAGDDRARVNDLIRRVHEVRDDVTALHTAFRLTQFLNQSGTLGRLRADRAIDLNKDADEQTRQRLRMERDIENVQAIIHQAQSLCTLLDDTAEALTTGVKRVRDTCEPAGNSRRGARGRAAAVVHVDFERGGLATERDIEQPLDGCDAPLKMTIARLLQARRLREVICLTDDPARLAACLGDLAPRVTVGLLDGRAFRTRIASVGAARRFSPAAWRGGIGSLTCYDELLEPKSCLQALNDRNLDAAVLVGADWCLVDPALIDALVERHLESPEALRVVFTQAPPGLCGLLIDQSALSAIAENQVNAGPYASIGALLGYVPFAPQADPIARPMCVPIAPSVRDLMLRLVPDSLERQAWIAELVRELGSASSVTDVAELAMHVAPAPAAPEHVVIDVGESLDSARELVRELPAGSCLTVRGRALEDHDRLAELVAETQQRSVALHVRTWLIGERWRSLIDLQPEVVSVDLHAITPELYEQRAGLDAYEQSKTRVEELLRERNGRQGNLGLPLPWIVPRITKCDDSYEHIEPFYDGWLRACGCAVIDAAERTMPGDRIQPLPLPESARRRIDRTELRVRADGSIVGVPCVTIHDGALADVWQRVLEERGLAARARVAA